MKNTTLKPIDIEKFRSQLLLKREQLLGDVKSMEDETLRRDPHDLAQSPNHLADVGSDNYQLENTIGLMGYDLYLLKEINDALKRIDNGTFGICQGDQRPIPRLRLRAIPWARLCIKCATLSDTKYCVVSGRSKKRDFSSAADIDSDIHVRYRGGKAGQVFDEKLLEDLA